MVNSKQQGRGLGSRPNIDGSRLPSNHPPEGRDELGDLLKVDEVADILRCCGRTVQNLYQRGELGYFRVGRNVRIPRKSVDEYIKKQRTIAAL